MIKRKRQWWRTTLVVLGWLVAIAVAYVVSETWKPSSETKLVIYLLMGVFIFNYAFNTIGEKLDEITWKLEDIERRLPPESSEDDFS